jgi:hypothetical protein
MQKGKVLGFGKSYARDKNVPLLNNNKFIIIFFVKIGLISRRTL